MPKISRNKLLKDVNDFILRRLVLTFKELRNEKALDNLLKNLFTNTERLMLAKRINIAMLLEEGLSYGEISKKLKVSHATISLVRQSLLNGDENYKKLIDGLNEALSDNTDRRQDYSENRLERMIKNFPTKNGKGRQRFLNEL